jgi:hypothetical protein
MFEKGDIVFFEGKKGIVLRSVFFTSKNVVVKFDDEETPVAFCGPQVMRLVKQ